MSDLLNTGKSALFAFQRALNTTSHNIANVNTEGYSRQRVNFTAQGDDRLKYMEVGQGVKIESIERVQDQFATVQVNDATSTLTQQKTYHNLASKIDSLVADESLSITPAINHLFNSIHDANNDPSSIANREVVIDSAQRLSTRFQTMQDELDSTQAEVNDRTRQAVDEAASLAISIAELNRRVMAVHSSTTYKASDDLKDQRDQLITELSELIDIDTVEEKNRATNVFIGKGISLVVNGTAQSMTAEQHDLYPDRLKIQIGNDVLKQDISPRIQGGEIGGLHEFATTTLHPTMQEIGRLAIVMADQLNQQHALGLDLNADAGSELFGTPLPQAYSSNRNSGTGMIDATIDDTSALQGSDYLLRFDAGVLTATRSSDGVVTSGTIPLVLDGLSVSMTGSPVDGDTFVLSATSRASGGFNALLTDPAKLALASPLATSSAIANLGDSRISDARVTDINVATFNDPIDFIFTSANTFDIVDAGSGTVITAGVTYSENSPITVNGWEISLSGEPIPGDTHHVEPNLRGRGNNANGLQLATLQQEASVDGNNTFNDAYGTVVARVGANTRAAETRTDALESLLSNAVDRKQGTQGVNLDEEAVNLTRYQQAYQASAQIIATADTLFQSVLSAIR
ncbi:MAG: flagellar hook-associated protein FlgK [Granulosicoccus sp.]|nr:flagellar hook-associated protein FlgK [Granulosicoccus sp.]